MSLIKILPESLINQIAAGEVVERPASVVKELVENSLDAGAGEIIMEIKDSGKTFIKISDDGLGMSKEDCELSLKRHSTSKISDEADLWAIKTMGFRGEALASIASVSKMTLKSRRENDIAGTQIDLDGGQIVTIKDAGISRGTKVEVYDLFFNTPARRKYLKKEGTEFGHIVAMAQSVALAHPDVAFRLAHNDKNILDLPRVTDLFSRISDIFGLATAEAMLPVFYGGSEFQIDGFVGKPVISRSTSQYQYLFVNGRPVQNFAVANRVKAAFHSMLMENKKPVYILNLKIDPALIDVNVHPRKIEIRFEDQDRILSVVYGCVKMALEKENLAPLAFTESRRYMSDSFPGRNFGESFVNESFVKNDAPKFSVQDAMDFSKIMAGGRDRERRFDFFAGQKNLQIANSYIVAESDEGLVLIDQHAAHERVRYEQLMGQFETQQKSVQPLLVPLQMELTSGEMTLIEENVKIFEELGFEIENFGGKTFIIHAVPGFLSSEDVNTVVKSTLDDIVNSKHPSKLQGKKEEIITYMACRSAVKFGQKLSAGEMQSLLIQLGKMEKPYTCPHGRPTIVSLGLSELEKMFGRK
ncbi:DNA mismatch repair endonuclease MutL [Candidatus Peregrinibacteria bacterium]|nr:DNA mismatch repair endonuclease MutL [Candidatus Peregrinibacteria bacterium]